MSSAAIRSEPYEHRTPRLRLVYEESVANAPALPAEPHTHRRDSPSASEDACVLVAGENPCVRSKMRTELHDMLPAGTSFIEAGETWEVIARAATSSMVVLTGDLGDVSAGSLMTLLGCRHPTLPVLAVSEQTPGGAAADVDVADA